MDKYENEDVLIPAFKKGDPAAEKFIFSKFFRSLCLLAENITGQLSVAEDLVAEAFIKLFSKRSEFEHIGSIKAFLYIVVRNSCYTYNSTRKRHEAAYVQMAATQREVHEDETPAAQLELIRAQLLEEIYQEIEQLPSQCRRISKMIFLDGQSTDEVAAALGISIQTVRNQKARAIQILKKQLFKDGKFSSLLLFSTYMSLLWDK